MTLRDLDERYVPRLAAALDRALRRVPSRSATPAEPAPLIVRLRRVDDRWTVRGPLALLREVPQLGAVLIAALLLTSAITVASRDRPATQADGAAPGETDELVGDGRLGPEINDSVPGYVAETRGRLTRVAPGRPDGIVVAVVQFSRYLSPEQVVTLLGPIPVKRVIYRPTVKDGVVGSVDVEQDLVADTRQQFGRLAVIKSDEARELRKVAKTIENDPAQKTEHEKDAAVREREARLLRGECRCVFAVVVEARLRLLLDALRITGIRTIDVGDVGAKIEDYVQITALLPEEKVTVTGGNQE